MIGGLASVLPLLQSNLLPALGVQAGPASLVLANKVFALGLALLVVAIEDVVVSNVTRAALYGHDWEVTGEALGDFELSVHIANVVDGQWIPSHMTRSFKLLGVILWLILGVR